MPNLKQGLLPLFLTFFLFSSIYPKAQQEVTEFGEFTADDISLKQCDFDKDAEAVVLFDKGKSYYNDQYNLVTERRVRFKILKERGIERGNISIKYYSDDNFESVFGVDAVIATFESQNKKESIKLDRKSIYTKKLNKYYSEITFALPNVKVGSIIEYKYLSQMKNYGGLREWIFQKEMPVLLSSYSLIIVPNAEFAYSVYKAKYLPIVVKRDAAIGGVLFEMNNIPGLRDEAYMGSANDYLQKVKFQFSGYKQVEHTGYGQSSATTTHYSTSWKELAKEMLEEQYFGNQLTKNLSGAEVLQQQWSTETDQFKKMRSIHNYVRSNFSWDHIYSKYAEDGVKGAWEKKTGTSGEINLILLNLLKSAGLTVSPLLVAERDFGKVDTAYPFVDQFDKVVAYVTIGDAHYILDGTDPQTPSFIIPYNLLNTRGFIVDKKNATLIKIEDDTKKNFNHVTLLANIDNNGQVDLDASVDSYNYARIVNKEKLLSDKKLYEQNFYRPYALNSLDTFIVDNVQADSLPLHHNAKASYALNKTGDYLLLNYNLFTGLTKNPFISENRFTDINFGCKNSYILVGTFNLPANLATQTLPKSVRLVTPDGSMLALRQVEQTDNTIKISCRIDFYKTLYTPDEYSEVQGFYKQMLDLLNEPIVLKAKS